MKVCIIGQGYIGLPTAALFARNHCEVVGVDVNEKMIETLMTSMGRKPNSKQVKQVMQQMNRVR